MIRADGKELLMGCPEVDGVALNALAVCPRCGIDDCREWKAAIEHFYPKDWDKARKQFNDNLEKMEGKD